VHCTATDRWAKSSALTFNVRVVDTTPPTLDAVSDPPPVLATSPAGAFVNFTLPHASDICDANPLVTATPPSGSLFPIGTTTVTVRATDASGNFSTETFNVTVSGDTTPPTIGFASPGPGAFLASAATPVAITYSDNPNGSGIN